MAYVYRHIRLDKNIPFYIGMGIEDDNDYKRAYSKYNRNIYWHNIVKKYGYDIEIVLDYIPTNEACKKEIEFIKLYGRKDTKTGTLVNMTDGGEGKLGFVHTDEIRKKISIACKGIKRSEELKAKMRGRVVSESIKQKIRATSKMVRQRNYPNILEIINDYKAQILNLTQIMQKYGLGKNTITRLMKRNDIELNTEYQKENISKEQLESVKFKGMTLDELENYFGVSKDRIVQFIRKYGLYQKQPAYRRYKTAYIFGN